MLALVLVSSIPAAKPGPGTSTGTGRVFVPNPVQSLGNESLTDQKDSIGFMGKTMTDLANSTISTAQSLYGTSVAAKVRAAFHARGIV